MGKALAQTDSSDVFVTTKVWYERLKYQQVLDSLKESSSKLQRDCIDLALIHWPSPDDEVPLEETLDALTEARERGLIKHFGVSNFTVDLLNRAVNHVGADNLLTNQIEVHPFMQNRKVTKACAEHGIKVTVPAVGERRGDGRKQHLTTDCRRARCQPGAGCHCLGVA